MARTSRYRTADSRSTQHTHSQEPAALYGNLVSVAHPVLTPRAALQLSPRWVPDRTRARWVPDRTRARPTLVPLLSLGRRVVATEGSGAQAGTFSMAVADAAAGGSALMPT